jgi:Protein of unknown function (DUF3352)
MPRIRLLLLPCLLLIAAALAACGGGGGAADADPATAVPAGTALYFEGVVRPEGDQREDVLDAAGKVLRTDDPEAKVRELIDKAFKESDNSNTDYKKDIEPWLGEKAAVWVTGVDRGKPGYVALLAAKDTEKAQEAIDKGIKEDGGKVRSESYEGVDYQVDEDGVAGGIVGDFFVAGTEPEFKRTIKAEKGDSLAEDKRFTGTVDELDEDRVGLFYIDLKPFFEQALKADPDAAAQLQQFRSVFPIDKLDPLAGALLADGDRIAFDTLMRGPGVTALRAFTPFLGAGETPLVKELPGDAWVAYGLPNVGPGLKNLFTKLAGAFGGAAATQQLQQQYGINLDRDVFSWIGDIGLWLRGSSQADFEGGLVIEATNADNMRSAFGKLVGLIQSQGGQQVRPVKVDGAAAAFAVDQTDLGKPVIIARSDERVVVSVGEQATADALSPAQKLGDSELYKQGKEALDGFEPTLLVSMPDVIKAVDASGEADPDWAKAKPYLEAFTVIASGGSVEDDELKSRVAAGLK